MSDFLSEAGRTLSSGESFSVKFSMSVCRRCWASSPWMPQGSTATHDCESDTWNRKASDDASEEEKK